MIMKTGMTNFNVNMYNEKIELLNEIIDTLNNTIYSFYSWGHTITPAFVKKLIDNPAEIYHEYLSFEYIAQRKCAEHGIKDKEYLHPLHQDCFHDIVDEMESIFESLNKFCRLLPHIKKVYGSLCYLVEEEYLNEPHFAETKNARLRIMQQCALKTIDSHSLNRTLKSECKQNEGGLCKWFSLIYINANSQNIYCSSACFLLWLHYIL